MERREGKKKEGKEDLIWMLNSGKLSQKCLGLNSSFKYSSAIKQITKTP